MSALAAKTIRGSFDIMREDVATDLVDAHELVGDNSIVALAIARPTDGAFAWCRIYEVANYWDGIIRVYYVNPDGDVVYATYQPDAELCVAVK